MTTRELIEQIQSQLPEGCDLIIRSKKGIEPNELDEVSKLVKGLNLEPSDVEFLKQATATTAEVADYFEMQEDKDPTREIRRWIADKRLYATELKGSRTEYRVCTKSAVLKMHDIQDPRLNKFAE